MGQDAKEGAEGVKTKMYPLIFLEIYGLVRQHMPNLGHQLLKGCPKKLTINMGNIGSEQGLVNLLVGPGAPLSTPAHFTSEANQNTVLPQVPCQLVCDHVIKHIYKITLLIPRWGNLVK